MKRLQWALGKPSLLNWFPSAVRQLNMPYRRAWLLIDAVNTSFKKPLVVTEVGGKKVGAAQ